MTWLRAFGAIGLAVALFVAGTLAWWMFVQDMRIRPQPDGSVVVDVQFLGEYFANATRIRITEVSNGKTVFEVRASGEFFPIWTFGLKAGNNRVDLDHTRTIIEIPNTGDAFDLKENTEYQATVWAIKSGFHVHRSQRFTLSAIPLAPLGGQDWRPELYRLAAPATIHS
jgi:hypothetical protein